MNLSRFTLYPHQAAGVQFMAPRGGANLSDGINVIGAMVAALPLHRRLAETGNWEVPSPKNPKRTNQVTFSRSGHLQCAFPGFEYRDDCAHVRGVCKTAFAA